MHLTTSPALKTFKPYSGVGKANIAFTPSGHHVELSPVRRRKCKGTEKYLKGFPKTTSLRSATLGRSTCGGAVPPPRPRTPAAAHAAGPGKAGQTECRARGPHHQRACRVLTGSGAERGRKPISPQPTPGQCEGASAPGGAGWAQAGHTATPAASNPNSESDPGAAMRAARHR